MSLALGYAATGLLIVGTGLAVMRHTTRRITATETRPASTYRADVALFLAAAVDLTRILADHARHVAVATVREMWGEPTGQHRAGWGPSTLQQVAPRRVVGMDFGPAATVVPPMAAPTIGEVAQAAHFPSVTQEFHRIVGAEFATVELGASA